MLRYFMDIVRGVRGAVRVNRRDATISVAILLTIALGLGAATAVLSVVRAALLQPLPYEDAGDLVQVGEQPIGSRKTGRTSFASLLDWRAGSKAFSGLEAYDGANLTARVGDDTEMIRGWRVTTGFFALLGVQPSVGRTWLARDEDTNDQVVVSQRLASRLGGEESALGRPLVVDGSPRTIIGVMPRSFHFGEERDVW